jgi:hypothetical protein
MAEFTAPDDDDNLQVILPLEDFAEDLEQRLGRANGNIYVRRPGIDGVHDGQVMVRLKKKRYIVIDYSIVPNEADLHHAQMSPYIRCPDGAGRRECSVANCHKVGVPVLLYDSDPSEPQSLYLRSGLCFTCQRNLNEKRRTQRKKPHEKETAAADAKVRAIGANHASVGMLMPPMYHHHPPTIAAAMPPTASVTPYHQVLMAVTSENKRIKLAHTNEPLTLAPDAIILNGPPDPSCKSARHGHGFAEIGTDLAEISKHSLENTQALVHAVSSNDVLSSNQPPPTSEDIARLYDGAFSGLCKSLYLLTQWKESWDGAMAAAFAQEHHHSHLLGPDGTLPNAIPDIHHPPMGAMQSAAHYGAMSALPPSHSSLPPASILHPQAQHATAGHVAADAPSRVPAGAGNENVGENGRKENGSKNVKEEEEDGGVIEL